MKQFFQNKKISTMLPVKLLKKITFLSKPKCLNGIKELNIECDGRAVICQMGTPGEEALTKTTLADNNFDVYKLFNSPEVRKKRLNCQICELNCQQHIYFEPKSDNIFKILFKFFTLIPQTFIRIFFSK